MAQKKSGKPSPARAAVALGREHAELKGLWGRLKTAKNPQALLPVLDELHPRLREHFEHEELPGGLYDTLGARSAEVRDLVDDHFVLLSAVRGLCAEARSPAAGQRLLKEAAAVAERLRSHEQKELQLALRLNRGRRTTTR